MKRIFLTLCISLILFGCSHKANQLTLSFQENFNKNNIKIKMEVLASIPVTEIYNGNIQSDIPNGYGENEWYFIYKDSLKCYFRHIKTNRNDNHRYQFYFYEQDGKSFIDVDITGKSPLKTVVELK